MFFKKMFGLIGFACVFKVPYPQIFIFHFSDPQVWMLCSRNTLRKDDCVGPKKIIPNLSKIFKNIQQAFKHMFDLIWCTYVLRVWDYRICCCNFQICKIYEYSTIVKQIISCFQVDIGTILAKCHSCFCYRYWSHIQDFQILLDNCSSFAGARLFEEFRSYGNPDLLICRNEILKTLW